MPTLPIIDFPTINLPFDLPKINLPTIDLSKVELPRLPFDLPKFDFSTIDLPNVDLPTAEQVIDFFRDAAFAGTGLMSLTAERIADLRKQLVEVLKTQVEKVRAAV